ncbi:hypothetical protein [Streptomyces sp. NBC_01477]|uniref:hypothetical protein n=1 Tax=Streptomyces sp. NBC_01477 TaxID=2976015 RepID=UPI002E3612AF|nr:hypothetical protein [Streptomyces sp. NBC_01477]
MAAASTKAVRFVSKYAALVLQDAEGVWARFERGVLETADAALVKRLRALDADESGVSETTDTPATESAPAKSASKGDWVAWAVHCGAEQAAAEALTRDQLAETFGESTPKE